jgi:cell surface protein SprA
LRCSFIKIALVFSVLFVVNSIETVAHIAGIPFLMLNADGNIAALYLPYWLNLNSQLLLPFYLQSDLELLDNPLLKIDSSNSHFAPPTFLKRPEVQRRNFYDHNFGINNMTEPNGVSTKRSMDPSAEKFTSLEMVDSTAISYPYTMSLDEYTKIRQKQIQGKIWDSLLTRYDLKQALSQGDLARMIGSATGMSIPIPPNPIMSIFGKPEISINVNGEVNLRIGWRWDSQNLGTVSQFGQTQSSPIFHQDIRVNVGAKIGDKLKFNTDWNTRRTFDMDNTFKVGYEGYDDDIIKLVEVGNVNLPLPTTLIRGGQTLFGVRADFQFGPLTLKTLFSQRRGERKFVDVTGGVSKQYFSQRAYDFARNHFFLDTAYFKIYNKYFQNSNPVIPPEADPVRIKEIEVYESTNDVREGETIAGRSIAISDLEPIRALSGETYPLSYLDKDIKPGEVERGNFARLDSSKYKYDPNLGTIQIRNLRPDRYYAVAYRIEGPTIAKEDDFCYGTLASISGPKDTLILKLLFRPNLQPGFKTLWDRQMKNIYDINSRNVNVAETKINVWYLNKNNDSTDVIEGAPDKLVTIFQVDQVNNASGAPQPDGLFDLVPPFFDANEGLITFPNTRPFDSALVKYFSRTEIGNPELAYQYTFSSPYDTTYEVARLNTARDRFIISGEVSGRATNRIQLGAFNLARGSVRVTLDGVELIENQDFVIDYFAGSLTLRNPRASMPNANLKVEYEQRDIFNIATKTLAGIRGDYLLYKGRNANANIGFTFMHYDQAAIIDRVRLGEEPLSNSIFGVDGTLDVTAPWLTKALDYLPFFDTKAPSSLNMKGEWAMILPTPNKRTSEIASDNSEPVVYIDDFEGAQRYIPLGLNASQWSQSSPPADSLVWAHDTIAANYRAKMFWYQYFIPRLAIRDVYPNNESYQAGRNFLNPLNLVFDPNKRGIYNKNPEFLDETNEGFFNPNDRYPQRDSVKPKVWGGMMRLLSTFNTNFDNENVEFLEVMIKVNGRDPGQTKFFIDLGQINEDVIPNQANNTEDGITAASPRVNGIIDVGEDVGIDGRANDREKEFYPFPLNQEADPARDDYAFDFQKNDEERNPDDFLKYNNYEGNASVSELGQFPDQEVLNRNNGQQISLYNSYFSYEVNLSQYDFEAETNPQVIGGNPEKGWFLYRIPIRKPNTIVGNPLFSNVQYVRVRVQGGYLDASIADWRLVGSQWQRVSNLQANVDERDSALTVAFVNLWENSGAPDYYTMPPGVAAPRLLNNPDPTRDVRMNEQSIAVGVKNLRYGDERIAVRFFRPMDLFFYKKLKFFIHGDGSMPEMIIPGAVPKAYAFIRFGIDSSNYYEYRRPLTRGWTDVGIDMIQLSAIKQTRDSLMLYDRYEQRIPGDEFGTFIIRGNPILTRVQFFGMGIANPNERFPNDLTTTMWIDELRLLSPEERADWSGIGSMNLVLADLGTVNANFQHKLPNFHQLEERFGDRSTTGNWSVTMNGNLEKFAPKSFNQMRIPTTFTHSEIIETPEFVANNDINLNEAATFAYNRALADGKSISEAQQARDNIISRSQTLRVSDSWAITGFKLGIPVNHWLISETFNKVTLGYSYAQNFERTPIYKEKFNWQWRLNLQYTLNVPEVLVVKPLSWLEGIPFFGAYSGLKLNFLPSVFNANITMNRRRQTEQSRFLDFPSPVIRDFSAQRNYSLNWKFAEGGFLNPIFDYSVNTNSTLVNFEYDEMGNQRTGSEIFNQMFMKNGELLNLGVNSLHTQTVTINLRPMLPNVFSINKYFDITGLFSTTFNWNDPLQSNPVIKDIVKNAGFSNNIRFSLGFRMKSLGDEWFGTSSAPSTPGGLRTNRQPDSNSVKKNNGLSLPLEIFKTVIFDWEKVDFIFNQQNASTNPGVFGGSGMHNFWVNGLSFQNSDPTQGTSWAYQMGLVENPHGGFNVLPSSGFPFFRFETFPGLRPPNARLQDNFRQTTTLEIKTSRPLWTGARLDLNWKTEVGFNKNQTVVTDAFGNPSFTNIISVESFNRTFMTFPSFFGINVFNNSIENVMQLYEQKKAVIEARFNAKEINEVQRNQLYQEALNTSFYDGLEAFSLSSGSAGKFLPAMNWTIRWEGLEKFALWKDYIKRMSFDHQYVSTYQENAQITDNGRAVLTQTVQYGFQPFIGFNASFDEDKLNGVLTASLRWSNTKSYNINNAARASVNSQLTNEITAQGSYTMRGFEFPVFGINLKNDLEYSFLFTYKHNQRHTFDITRPSDTYVGEKKDGETLDGNTQIIIEPRARYSLSSRLTASFFVRYEGTFTEGAAQPGFHTTQVGFDLRISVAGGR